VVKRREIPLSARTAPETPELPVIGADARQLGVVQILCKPAVITRITAPTLLERLITLPQFARMRNLPDRFSASLWGEA